VSIKVQPTGQDVQFESEASRSLLPLTPGRAKIACHKQRIFIELKWQVEKSKGRWREIKPTEIH